MWMRGYTNPSTTVPDSNGGGANDQFGTTMSPVDSVNGRRLRPLIPKPSTSTTPSLPTFFNHGNCDTASLFTLNHLMASPRHHLMGGGEQGRRDQFNGHQSVVVSSRWNPTPDQLRALEELYRRGTRTPSADQIQHITAQLRRYGKIEGKNVFYWFQNHKARERQKRRRQQLENTTSSQEQPAGDGSNHNDNKGSKTGFETEQTKLWAAPTNCSTLADQESVYKKPEKAAAECVAEDEWVQFQDHQNSLQIASTTMLQDSHGGIGDDHRRRRTSLNLIAKNSMWDKTQLPLPKPTIMHQTSLENYQGDEYEDHHKVGALTLQLFPLRSNGAMDLIKDDQDDDDDDDDDEKGTHLTSCQFIEFLPLKNSTAY